MVSARLNTVDGVIAAGSWLIAKSTVVGGLVESLLANWADTPVAT